MTDYAAVLLSNYPDAEWTLTGDGYDGLSWHSDVAKPSQAELDAAWPAVLAAQQRAAVQKARAARYQAESDPLFFEAQRGEDGTTLDDWKAKVAEIKADLPYPS